MNKLIILLLCACPSLALADWFSSPKNYDECVLENMKGTTSDLAAKAIYVSCRNKFPVATLKPVTLSASDLAKVTGSFVKSVPDYFSDGGPSVHFSIYNGSPWSLYTIVFRVINTKTGAYKDYVAKPEFFSLNPLTSGKISFQVMNIPKSWSWKMISARTMK